MANVVDGNWVVANNDRCGAGGVSFTALYDHQLDEFVPPPRLTISAIALASAVA